MVHTTSCRKRSGGSGARAGNATEICQMAENRNSCCAFVLVSSSVGCCKSRPSPRMTRYTLLMRFLGGPTVKLRVSLEKEKKSP